MTLQKALALARKGYAVCPILKGSKRPALPGGFNGASRDPETVADLWAMAGEDSPVGISPDLSDPPLLIVDIDQKPGKDGLAALSLLDPTAAVQVELGEVFQATPSGGAHLAYRADGDYKSTVDKIAAGIDTRAKGGGIVVYADDLPDPKTLPLAPDWAEPARIGSGHKTKPAPVISQYAAMTAAKAYLMTAPVAVEFQGGNSTTYAVACQLRNLGLSEDDAANILLEVWNPRCLPPWEESELRKIVESAYKYSQDGPRLDRVSAVARLLDTAGKTESPFIVYHSADFIRLPAPKMLVQDMLVENSLAMLIGPYGSYKSFVALDIAASVAHGKKVFGKWKVEKPGRALYCVGEGLLDMAARYRCWLKYHGEEPGRISFMQGVPNISKLGYDAVYNGHFEKLIADYDLIVIDTLARAAIGTDENSNSDSQGLMEVLNRILQTRNITILLVHHTGKAGGYMPRGASAIGASVDTVLHVESGEEGVLLSSHKQKMLRGWQRPWVLEPVEVEDPEWPSLVLECTGELDDKIDPDAGKVERRAQEKIAAKTEEDQLRAAILAKAKNGGIPDDPNTLLAQVLYKLEEDVSPNEWVTENDVRLKRWKRAFKRIVSSAILNSDGSALIVPGVVYKNGALVVV